MLVSFQDGVFYLHEDEWAMIDLVPAENWSELLRLAEEARTFGDEHFDGTGWTAMHVIPPPTVPLAWRALSLTDLQQLLGERFLLASSVQSGYSSYRETLPDAFAFVEAETAGGALYGQHKGGLVTHLHLFSWAEATSARSASWIEVLQTLGTKYQLVLADWWRHTIIDLRERTQVVSYLEASASQE